MDVSELLSIFAAALFGILLLAAVPRLRQLAHPFLRVISSVAAGCVGVAALLMASILLYFLHTYTRHQPALLSPDGKHLALTSYTVGDGSGVDTAEVSVRHAWDPYAHRVYTGPVRYQPDARPPEPELEWLDATHLRIRFHTLLDGNGNPLPLEQGCAAQAEEIVIRCEETRVHVNLPGR